MRFGLSSLQGPRCRAARGKLLLLCGLVGLFVVMKRHIMMPKAFVHVMPLLPAGVAPEPGAWETRAVEAGDRELIEDSIDLSLLAGDHSKYTQPKQKRVRLVRKLADLDEVNALLDLVSSAPLLSRETRANPVVTPLQILAEDGAWNSDALSRNVEPLVEQRLLPYMRLELGCPSLIVSQVLLRRYKPEQRRAHKVHFDHNALGTAIFDLTPQVGSGLFVGSGSDASSHFFVPFQSPGDVAVHSWDVPHGVRVKEDHSRVSIVVWVKPEEDVERDTTQWYVADARSGDPDASYRLGLESEEHEENAQAIEHHLNAAKHGQVFAMRRLHSLIKENGDPRIAMQWLEKAAGAGSAEAQVDLGDALQSEGDFQEAIRQYEAAAAQQDGRALHRLGAAYLHGMGVRENKQTGLGLLREAADLGWSDAQFVLACRPELAKGEAAFLLQAAADQGHPGALFARAAEENRRGNYDESVRFLEEAAHAGHPEAAKQLVIFKKSSN